MVHFVGAGPGAPDLITQRGAALLQAADCIIYAGSLVNPALLGLATKAKRVVGILFVAAGVLNFACGFFYFGKYVFMASLPVLLLGSVFAPFLLAKRSSRK